MNAREMLIALYLDYVNNYLTVAVFAEHHGLTREQGLALIDLGRELVLTPHPEA